MRAKPAVSTMAQAGYFLSTDPGAAGLPRTIYVGQHGQATGFPDTFAHAGPDRFLLPDRPSTWLREEPRRFMPAVDGELSHSSHVLDGFTWARGTHSQRGVEEVLAKHRVPFRAVEGGLVVEEWAYHMLILGPHWETELRIFLDTVLAYWGEPALRTIHDLAEDIELQLMRSFYVACCQARVTLRLRSGHPGLSATGFTHPVWMHVVPGYEPSQREKSIVGWDIRPPRVDTFNGSKR